MNERQIFEAALDISDLARREAFLSQACGADTALRTRVDALLTAHAAASQFLETPAVQQLHTSPDSSGEDTMQLPPSHLPAEGDSDDAIPNGPDISFLQPSKKAGSIGTLGHYEILNVLGQGAFGIVFRAFDEKLHRHVAIKTMSVQMAATSPPRKRFLREARAAAAIRHENVVQVYSVEEQPLPYLVMEFIDGETLQQKQRDNGPLELPELLHIGRQIASGLAAAHAQTLIHRDVKPGNILIEKGAEQKVKITDFGLARAADDASLTRSGMISGTPLYMAPEQALGQTLDHRSDLFSLGSVLYELATGRPPFRAPNTVAVLRRVVDDTPRPIQEIIPETPDWLVTVVDKLLEKKPDDRYQSAKEVTDLLARCQSELQLTGQVTCVPVGNPASVRREPDGSPTLSAEQPSGSRRTLASAPAARGILGQAWHEWWSEIDRWIALSIQTLLILVHLGCMICLLSMGASSGHDAEGHATFEYRLGVPSPWFRFLVYPEPLKPFQTMLNLFSTSMLIGLVGCLAYYVNWRIEKVRNPQMSKWDRPGIILGFWGLAALIAVSLGLWQGYAALEKPRVAVESGDPASGAASAPRVTESTDSTDPDRRAAEWVLSIDGTIRILEDGKERRFSSAAEMPPGLFPLTGVELNSNRQVNDSLLTHFQDCKNLTVLNLNYTNVSDVGLAHFKDIQEFMILQLAGTQVTDAELSRFHNCKKLTHLDLNSTQVTDAGLTHFQNCPNLTNLGLSQSRVSDAGLAHFNKCPNLSGIDLNGTQVSNDGLSALFQNCPNLTTLSLNKTHVSDAGLAHVKTGKRLWVLELADTSVSDAGLANLVDCLKLTSLNVKKTKVTEAGVKKLSAALPGCKIEWDGGVIEPTVSPDRRAAEYVLSIGGYVQIKENNHQRQTTTVEDLPRGAFELMLVRLTGNQKVSDVGLATFQNCRNLTELNLNYTPVTDAGLAHFQDCKNLIILELHGTQLSDAGLATFQDCHNLSILGLHGTQLSDAGLANFQDCHNLTVLDVSGTQVSDAGLAHFKDCNALVGLTLQGTKLSDAGLAHFKDCKVLTHLNLSGTQVSDAGLAQFKECQELTILELHGTRVSAAGLAALFENCKNIKILGLSQTPLTDTGLVHFKECQYLSIVDLDATQVGDASLESLADCPKLAVVTVKHTKVTEAGVKKLSATLPKCKIKWDGGVIEPTVGWHGWPAEAPPPANAPFDAEQAQHHQEAWAQSLGVPVEYTNSLGMQFRLIPPGEFMMGSTAAEIEAVLKEAFDAEGLEKINSEAPQHKVVLTQPIYLGVHEVTQAEYEKIMQKNPSKFAATGDGRDAVAGLDTGRHPVENVCWNDTVEFCAKLSEQEKLKACYVRSGQAFLSQTGNGYRLPTEAEWEFAGRAGTTTRFSTGDQARDLAQASWFKANSGGRTHAVGGLTDNAFGLHDIHGNVHEWVQDWWESNYYREFEDQPAMNPSGPVSGFRRALRTGGWRSDPSSCRTTLRDAHDPASIHDDIGFRVSLSVDAVRQALKLTGPALPQPVSTTPPAPASDLIDYAAERQVAEWAIELKAQLAIESAGQPINITEVAQLPSGPFHVHSLVIPAGTALKPSDLQMIGKLRSLKVLSLRDTTGIEAAPESLSQLTTLEYLDLLRSGITDAGMPQLAGMKNLAHLELTFTAVGNAGMAAVSQLTHLKYLGLGESRVGDDGLAQLKTLDQVEILSVGATVTDQGLGQLANLPKLTEVAGLKSHHLTEVGIGHLQQLPNVTHLNVVAATDDDLVRLKPLSHLTALDFNLHQFSGSGLAALSEFPKLDHLNLGDHSNFDDSYWPPLVKLTSLRKLYLQEVQVTADGIAKFREQRPEVWLYVNGTVYPASPMASDAIDYAAERQVAEWAVGAKTRFNVESAGQVIDITDVSQLPSGPCHIHAIAITPQSTFGPNDFQQIGRLRGMIWLGFEAPLTDGSCLVEVAKVKSLQGLQLQHSQITDAHLSALTGLTNLTELDLVFTPIGDAGMGAVSQLTSLKKLHLGESRVGDKGLAQLKTLSQLDFLHLGATVTDQGLGHLANFPKLTAVAGLKSHHLTEVGLGHLQLLPNVTALNVVAATDEDLVRMKPVAHLTSLTFDYHQFTASGLKALSQFAKLEYLDLGDQPSVDDSYWPPLVKLSALRKLLLQDVQVTAAGIAKFREQRPEVLLNVNGTEYPATQELDAPSE